MVSAPGEQEEPLPLVELVAAQPAAVSPSGPPTSMASSPSSRCQLAQTSLAMLAWPRSTADPPARLSARVRSALSAHHLEPDCRPRRAGRGAPGRRRRRFAWRSRRRRRARGRSRPAGRGWRRHARSRAAPSPPSSPRPGSPTIRSASVRAPEKNTSLNSEVPVSCSIRRTSTPGWSRGTSRKDSPLCRWEPGSVRASTKTQSDDVRQRGPDLLPVDHPLRRRRAGPWCCTAARSEPAPGSE